MWQSLYSHINSECCLLIRFVSIALSQILLGVVTAMLVIIGYDNHINGSLLDIMGATMVFIIGGFGSVWAARQMERYRYWEFIAFTYQKKLKKLVPELHKRTEHAPDDIQRAHLINDNKKDGKKSKSRFFGFLRI